MPLMERKLCSVCGMGPVVARGFCRRHYSQWYRKGTTAKRTRADKNEFRVFGRTAQIVLYDWQNNPRPEKVLVDTADIPLVKHLKWGRYGKYVGSYFDGRPSGEKSRRVYLHRLLMRPEAGKEVDHLNGNPYDNRRVNLEVVDRRTNLRRGRGRKKGGRRGVYKDRHGWKATISATFSSKKEAVNQREIWESQWL